MGRRPKVSSAEPAAFNLSRLSKSGGATAQHLAASKADAPPAGLEPAIFGLEVRRLVH